jgi:ribosomal protein S18 acetylase RimI-like enzyme
MTNKAPYEILDLRHFGSKELTGVLDAESAVWLRSLHWDYRSSARLLTQYLDARTLPGYVAVRNGRVIGYGYFVYEESKAVLGDVFATPHGTSSVPGSENSTDESREIEDRLLRHQLETLFASPGMDRIESQLLVHPSGVHTHLFEATGFQIYPRLLMTRTLHGPRVVPVVRLPSSLELRGWRDEDLHPAGRLIAEAYNGHLDSYINNQYRTIHGSLRFLHNIVRYPGCGVFTPNVSQVIVERHSRELVALLLCSRISADSGHITQICVHPQYRRQGLARLLLTAAASGFVLQGATEISLTVTEGNQEAVKLYQGDGYETLHRFDAAVWEKNRLA